MITNKKMFVNVLHKNIVKINGKRIEKKRLLEYNHSIKEDYPFFTFYSFLDRKMEK